MPETQQTLATSNGHAASLQHDDAIVAAIRVQADALEARRAELQEQLDEITPQLRRYEKAILALQGEPLRKDRRDPETGEIIPRAKPGPKPKAGKTTSASEESIARNRAAIAQLTTEHEDFTQVQVRAITGESSGASSIAFKALREQGVIRLARQDGNAKYFRLTRAALTQPLENLTLTPPEPRDEEPVARYGGTVPNRGDRKVGAQTLREVEQVFRQLAAEGDGEVRQVQVAEHLPISNTTVSVAFKQLADADVIQWERDSGPDKYFTLVAEAQS